MAVGIPLRTVMSSYGGSESVGNSVTDGNADTYGYDSPTAIGPTLPDSYTDSASTTNTRSDSSGSSWAHADQTGRLTASTVSESRSVSRGRSRAETVVEAQTEGTAHTESVANTEGIARTTSRTVGRGESEGRNWASTEQRGSSVGVGNTAGSSTGRSDTWSTGFTETLASIMENHPSAVHSKDNVVHMAAELLCS